MMAGQDTKCVTGQASSSTVTVHNLGTGREVSISATVLHKLDAAILYRLADYKLSRRDTKQFNVTSSTQNKQSLGSSMTKETLIPIINIVVQIVINDPNT